MLMLANGNGESSARSRFIGLMPGGRSLYCGWNPPTLSAIVPLSPPVSTKQASPSMVIGPTCELTSEPKMLTPWASKNPTTVACNTAKGTSSHGSDTAKRPKMATPDVPAITATVADTMVGVPQPTLSIGPAKKSPRRTGKQRSSAGRTDGASATGSRGKNIEPMAPLNVASCRASLSMPRLTPTTPPTPTSVKPNDSWIGGRNDADRMATTDTGAPGEIDAKPATTTNPRSTPIAPR